MKIAGIVAEYNPFHNGHRHQIEKTREKATHIIAVMSGNFVQRGEPALFSKWKRAKAALTGGADLVLELPLPWSISSAEAFARGGVGILNSLGCVDILSFGAECKQTEMLTAVAKELLSAKTDKLIKAYLTTGCSYPAARESAVIDALGYEYGRLLASPNNILAVEYIKALLELDSEIEPSAVLREGAGHDSSEQNGTIASASFIRGLIQSGGIDIAQKYIPSMAFLVLQSELERGEGMLSMDRFEFAVLSKLRFASKEYLKNLPDVSEGLENRISSAIIISRSLQQLYDYIKTKRYPLSRIRRIVTSAYLGVKAGDNEGIPPYVRVLGFNERGREILKIAKDTSQIPLIMRAADIAELNEKRADKIFELECKAADQYALLLPSVLPCGTDYTANVIRF